MCRQTRVVIEEVETVKQLVCQVVIACSLGTASFSHHRRRRYHKLATLATLGGGGGRGGGGVNVLASLC